MGLIPSKEQVSFLFELECHLRVRLHRLNHLKQLFAFLLTPNIFIFDALINLLLKVITHELLDQEEVEVTDEVRCITVFCQCQEQSFYEVWSEICRFNHLLFLHRLKKV